MIFGKKKKKEKVLVAMSGGVDSSVAAAMMCEQGYEVIGIFMHFWAEPDVEADFGIKNKCCSLESFNDARRVAQKFNFPIYTINLDEHFKQKVVDRFLQDYANGETPNPCVNCNKHIKFDEMLKKADALGAHYIVTGHYAKIKKKGSKFELWRPHDKDKDQTYFLYTLNQEKLSRVLFPLSGFTKRQVRNMASRYGLDVAEKRESQEICFIPEKTHNEFLKRHLQIKSGQIRTLSGEVVGEHQGLPLYTLGQRRGVEIGGTGPYYVARLDLPSNILYVTNDPNDPSLYQNELIAREVNWIKGVEPKFPTKCEAVIRYRQAPSQAELQMTPSGLVVRFLEPQRAIMPGQSVVFYQKGKLLGGGVIN